VIEAVPKLNAGHDAVLQVRAGIATGLVVVGDLIGEGVARDHGMVGDTPNLAARLQSLAEPGQTQHAAMARRHAVQPVELQLEGDRRPLRGARQI
jgi:class 3 adenylate cyclase